jgi:hypothetical protein
MKCLLVSPDNADVMNRAVWSSEEMQVAWLRLLLRTQSSTGLRLVVGIPGHRKAGMTVSEVDQA